MSGHDDLLEPFLVEARDLIGRTRHDLARLADAPSDRGALEDLFRALHTLKGSAALLELTVLARLLHGAETALERARSGALTAESGDTLARVLDVTEGWTDALEAGREPDERLLEAAGRLMRRLEGGESSSEEQSAEPVPAWAAGLTGDIASPERLVAIRYRPSPDAYFRGDDPLAIARAIPGLLKLSIAAEPAEDPVTYDPFRCTLQIEAVAQAPLEDVRAALRLVADQVELAAVAPVATAAGLQLRSLHVDAARLDAVAALVGELVVAKNALAHETRKLLARTAGVGEGRDLLAREASLERLVSDLHVAVTDLRLTPLRQLFARFPRQVREIADGLGKAVDLRTSGETVALDKSVVEGLFEPLLHLVRNAIDHGVETPDVRRAAGKPERATISLDAEARGAEVVIEVADDGRGIDVAAVRRSAIARGILDARAAEALSDAAAAELVFAQGFSTAAAVSDLSGRGVGMDAVRTSVARLGGQVSLANRPGKGLCVRLALPAEVLLQKILVVRSGLERFGVPLQTIRETHRVQRLEVTAVREGRAYVRRDTVIPLVRLNDLVGASTAEDAEVFPVLHVGAGDEQVGVQVDGIEERLEASMRPMSGLMAGYPGVLGTVLQADGQVLLVLDLAELAA